MFKSYLASFRATKELLRILFQGYKFQIGILILLGFLGGILGGLSVSILVPFISYVLTGGALGSDFISQAVRSVLSSLNLEPSIRLFLALLVSLFALKAAVLFVFGYVTVRISTDYEKKAMEKLYRAMLDAGWPYLLGQKIGHLQNMLTVHIQFLPRLMLLMSNVFLNFASFLIYILVAFKLSWVITASALGLGAVMVTISRPFVARTHRYSKEQAALLQSLAHEVNENVTGLKTLKAMSVEKESAEAGLNLFKRLRDMKIKLFFARKLNSLGVEPLSIIFIALIFALSYKTTDFDLGVFAVTMYLVQKIFSYVESIQGMLHVTGSTMPYVENLLSLQQEAIRNQEPSRGREKFSFEKNLEFRNITFIYRGKSRPALSGVTFEVRKGEMVGIIGPSGAGKTTIVDLLLRLFLPDKGEICLDGKSVEEIDLREWRRNIGYVSQDMFLKNDTIRNNITFYDPSVTNEEVLKAAKMAYAYDFIKKLPAGFESVVGERGVKLSGGERQRIILARIFARKPNILVLDEATSSLDNESEAMIKEAIAKLKGEVTIIAIAHRLSTIMNADRLLVLEEGKIRETGIPQKLLKYKSSYLYKTYHIINV